MENEREFLNKMVGKEFTLCELTRTLADTPYFEDVFETCDIGRDILDNDANGSISDIEGDYAVCFETMSTSDSYLDYVIKVTEIV